MKWTIVKRNAVIVTVLVFVCAAVYLNWSYNRDEAETESLAAGAVESSDTVTVDGIDADIDADGVFDADGTGLYYSSAALTEANDAGITETAAVSEYFASARLTREQARDSAREILQQTSEAADASQQIVDDALAEISVMAQYTVSEAQIENLVMAKGYSECVAFISGDGISVTVSSPSDGLTDADVARISEIVMEETGFSPDNIKIIEVN